MSLEGELRLKLRLQAQRCVAVELASSRPDVAQSLLQGRNSREALAAVPLLFSVCARSQSVAAQGAVAAALQAPPAGAQSVLPADPASGTAWDPSRAQAALTAELLRETACQLLLQGPGWLGERPTATDLQAARAFNLHLTAATAAASCHAAASPTDLASLAAQTGQALFGMPAQAFAALRETDDLEPWLAVGATVAARLLRHWRACETPPAGPLPRLLPASPDAEQRQAWAAAMAEEPGFCRRPHWQGQPAETGALARQQAHPLVAAWLQRHPARMAARLLARLVELAAALAGQWQPALGCTQLAPGQGLAWVDNARGLLMHRVHLQPEGDGSRVRLWRILAPTEWNFHPQGTLVRSLLDNPDASAAAPELAARRLVQSLDPCVACHVETHDA